jgi:hypothetical protein
VSRRTIFAGAGAVGAVAVVASMLPTRSPDADAAAQPVKAKPSRGGGYSLSEHVKQYYKTTLV